MAIIDELISILGYKIEGRDQLREYTSGLERAAGTAASLGRALGALGTIAGAAAIGGLTMLGKGVLETSAKFEGYQATLEVITGSAENARKALDWVTTFGATTPYEVGEVTEAFVKLKAYGLDPMDGSLKAVGDAASAMNKPLMTGVEAIADAVTGENERLKEYGITAKVKGDQVTYSWIQNGKKLSATMKKTGTEVSDFLKKNFEDRFGGAMEKQSHTWNGLMSNLGDAWTGFQRKIGDSGFFKAMERNLEHVMDWVNKLANDGTLDRWARKLSDILTWGAEAFGTFVLRVARHVQTISGWIEKAADAFKPLKWVILGLIAWAFPLATAIGAVVLVLEDFVTYLEGGESALGHLIEKIHEATGLDIKTIEHIFEVLAGGAGLLLASLALGSFTLALNPLTAGLLAFAAAFAAAKAGFDYLAALKTETDKKIDATKAVETPQGMPGYVQGVGAATERMIVKGGRPQLTGGRAINMNGAAVQDQPLPPNLDNSMTPDALDWKLMMQNAEGNGAKMGPAASSAVINDSSNKSVNTTNNISVPTTVNVQQATQAPGAAGTAVGNAIGQAVVPSATRLSAEPAL